MRINWRSSTPEEVTEINAAGNPVSSSLTPAEDLALRTAALGLCEYCGGPLTEIWSAGWSRNTVTYVGSVGGNSTASLAGSGMVTALGGGSGPRPAPGESESWRFCSEDHMDAFLAQRLASGTLPLQLQARREGIMGGVSDDLVAFVTARLDEDAVAAMAAAQSGNQFTEPGDHDPRWQRTEGHSGGEVRDMCAHHRGCIVVFDEGAPGPEEAAHIARHDPARALREVEAKRAILDAYVRTDGDSPRDRDRGRWDSLDAAVRHVAAVWSDHPDYRP